MSPDKAKIARDEFYSGTLRDRKNAAFDALDRMLGPRGYTKLEKAAAFRAVASRALEWANNLERWEKQQSNGDRS